MGIYITQYKEDGIVKEGPCICSSWENALEQAYYFNLEIVGRINSSGMLTDDRVYIKDGYREPTNCSKHFKY